MLGLSDFGVRRLRKPTELSSLLTISLKLSEVANNVLAETGDEGRAVRAANSAVARAKRHQGEAGPEFNERDGLNGVDT